MLSLVFFSSLFVVVKVSWAWTSLELDIWLDGWMDERLTIVLADPRKYKRRPGGARPKA